MIPTPLPPTMASDRRFSSEVISTESTAAKEGNRASRASRLYGRLLDEEAGGGGGGKAEFVFGYEIRGGARFHEYSVLLSSLSKTCM